MIIIISDTHNYKDLALKLKDKYEDGNCSALIHLGDVVDFEIFSILSGITKNMYFVKGNNDIINTETVKSLKENGVVFSISPFEFSIENYGNFVIMHEPYFIEEYTNKINIDYILYGHTHKAGYENKSEKTIINPGSLSYFMNKKPSYMILQKMIKKIKIMNDIK